MNIRWNVDEFERLRKSPEMVALLETVGAETVARCNTELHAAQARRRQPVEDGYDHKVNEAKSRAKLIISATTARGMAHEAVNQAILKNMPIGEVKNRRPPDHDVPRELGRRGAEANGWGQ